MTIRPTLFQPPLVRAMWDGRKTNTRRLLRVPEKCRVVNLAEIDPHLFSGKANDPASWGDNFADDGAPLTLNDYAGFQYAPGDLLWVREAWQALAEFDRVSPSRMKPTSDLLYIADRPDTRWNSRYRQAMHMPRWASRLTLKVTGVKVERVQDISAADSIAEGVECESCIAIRQSACNRRGCFASLRAFATLWDSINAKRAPWESNPWVVAITFEVIKANVDALP